MTLKNIRTPWAVKQFLQGNQDVIFTKATGSLVFEPTMGKHGFTKRYIDAGARQNFIQDLVHS